MARKPRFTGSCIVLAAALLFNTGLLNAGSSARAGDFPVRLRNDLTPGSLARYNIRLEGRRSTQERLHVEEITYTQSGILTLVVLRGNKQSARRAWMLVMDEPVVQSMTRGGLAVEALPAPRAVGLPPKVAQLKVGTVSASRGPASVVGGSRVQQAALLLALDIARWPKDAIAAGETWQTTADRAELDGDWALTYVAGEGKGGARVARGTFAFTGKLAGPLAGVADVERASGDWRWRVAKRSLEASTAEVVLRYGDPAQTRTLTFRSELTLDRRARLKRAEREAAADDLETLGAIGTRISQGNRGDAVVNDLETFVEQHPDSLWHDIARDLLERVRFDEDRLAGMDRDRLLDTLTNLVTRWQTAAVGGDVERLQPIRATFRAVTTTNRGAVHAVALESEEENFRAMAAFCAAFGPDASDQQTVERCCADRSPRVRAWAVYGLAERRAPVKSELLFSLLADEDQKVRQRACMAVGAIVAAGNADRARYVDRLLVMTRADAVHEVRVRAAEAVSQIARPEDLGKLLEAVEDQEVPPAERLLKETIRRLGGRLPAD